MKNKRERWLWVAPLLVLLLAGGSNFWRTAWSYWYSKEESVSIGFFNDTLAEERAAFKRLSAEMKRHPHLNVYKIRSSDAHVQERDFLIYTRVWYGRPTPHLRIDHRFAKHLSPGIRERANVTEAQIHTVAQKSGDWRDL